MQFYFTADDIPSMDTSACIGMHWQLKRFTNSFSICDAFHLTWLCALIACWSHGASWKIYYHGSGFLRTRGTRRLYYYHSFFSLVLVWRLSSLFFSFIWPLFQSLDSVWHLFQALDSFWDLFQALDSKASHMYKYNNLLKLWFFFPANSVNLKSVLFYHL